MAQEVRAVPTAAETAAAATAGARVGVGRAVVQVGVQGVVERGGCSAKSRRRAQSH